MFVLFTVAHIIEHLSEKKERDLESGVWLRLILALLAAMFVMLSGFILKADGEGIMARQILNGLLGVVPVIGENLRLLVLGPEKSLRLIYLHHLMTTTFFIWVVIIEHVRRVWPEILSFVYIFAIVTIFAILSPPGLLLLSASVIRGPWYFIGLQELLHWIPDSLIVIGILTVCLSLFSLVRWVNPIKAQKIKRMLVVFLILYAALTLNNWGFRDGNWNQLFL